jgi:hypothetical protein
MKPNIHTRHKIYELMLKRLINSYEIFDSVDSFCYTLHDVLYFNFKEYNSNELIIDKFKELYKFKPKHNPYNQKTHSISYSRWNMNQIPWFPIISEEKCQYRIKILQKILKNYNRKYKRNLIIHQIKHK